jgi:hypothetical protein
MSLGQKNYRFANLGKTGVKDMKDKLFFKPCRWPFDLRLHLRFQTSGGQGALKFFETTGVAVF